MPRAEPGHGNSSVLHRMYHLFETRTSAETGKPLTGKEIAERARALDYELSPSYVLSLRNRSRTNPSLESLEALAAVYGVNLAYFFTQDDDLAVADEALAAAMRNGNVRNIALRTAAMSPEAQVIVSNLVNELGRLDLTRHGTPLTTPSPATDGTDAPRSQPSAGP